MQRDRAYDNLQKLLFEEFQNKEILGTPDAVKDFVRLAAAKGLYIDDLIRMAESGMSGRQIADAVISAVPPEGGKTIPAFGWSPGED